MSTHDERAPGDLQCEACGEEHHEREMTIAGHGDNEAHLCESCTKEFTELTGLEPDESMDCDAWDALKDYIRESHTGQSVEPESAERDASQFTLDLNKARVWGNIPEGDPEAEVGMNGKRAEWARAALVAFHVETGVDLPDAMKDLLCDLAHFCDRYGFDLFEEWNKASQMYAFETQDTGKQFNAK